MPTYGPMGYGSYPYFNPQGGMQPNFYQNPMQPQVQQQPQQNLKVYDFVNGIEGAKGYQIQPNTMMMLLDSEYYVAYKKTSNNLGQSNIEYLKLVPMTEQEAREFMNPQYKAPTNQNIDINKFVSRQEFEAKINELMAKINPTPKEVK